MTDTVVHDDVETGGFIAPVAMEDDPAELFAGDTGTLDADVRRVLVRLLQRRFLLAERNPAQWRTLLENQQVIESRLHDLFVHLVVDHERGIAYKRQVRSAELDVPVLLRDEPYTRAETLVLVHLRTVFQRERGAGETSARVDVEELEATALTYFDPDDTNVAGHQREIRTAVARLAKDGIIEEESEGRYRVTPLVEIVLSTERLAELRDWLRSRGDEPDDAPVADDRTEASDAPGVAEAGSDDAVDGDVDDRADDAAHEDDAEVEDEASRATGTTDAAAADHRGDAAADGVVEEIPGQGTIDEALADQASADEDEETAP